MARARLCQTVAERLNLPGDAAFTVGLLAARMPAAGSLATYAAENPEDPFPEVVEGGPVYDGEGLGHPLLPRAACVRNDVRLGGDAPHVLVVSGSNMSSSA